jgi:hypothetical protein
MDSTTKDQAQTSAAIQVTSTTDDAKREEQDEGHNRWCHEKSHQQPQVLNVSP